MLDHRVEGRRHRPPGLRATLASRWAASSGGDPHRRAVRERVARGWTSLNRLPPRGRSLWLDGPRAESAHGPSPPTATPSNGATPPCAGRSRGKLPPPSRVEQRQNVRVPKLRGALDLGQKTIGPEDGGQPPSSYWASSHWAPGTGGLRRLHRRLDLGPPGACG